MRLTRSAKRGFPPHGFHELSGIIAKLDLVIDGFWREALCLFLTKARDMLAGNFCQVGISRVAQESEELVCRISIEREG